MAFGPPLQGTRVRYATRPAMPAQQVLPIWHAFYYIHSETSYDQLRPVTTGFLRFFAVLVHGSWILKLSGTGLVRGPSKKGNRTETGPDFKALVVVQVDEP